MALRPLSLADALLREAWSAWPCRHVPESWWPVDLCVEPLPVLS